jgi:hypothetical protein
VRGEPRAFRAVQLLDLVQRSSIAVTRCAVVRAVMPPPIGPSSSTITLRPSG